MTTKLYTRKEAAARLGVSLITLRRRIDAGDIAVVNVGATGSKQRTIRISEDALEAFIQERTNVA